MISPIPPYPRIPHLVARAGATRDDRVLAPAQLAELLALETLVEEKLDGASVALWLDDSGKIEVATRGGPGAMDRAGQLGRLRAWATENQTQLDRLWAEGVGVYGEWLWLQHTVAYDRLSDYLVVLDLWSRSTRTLLDIATRDRLCHAAGLAIPAALFRGVPRSLQTLDSLMAQSRFGSQPMEGLVLREPVTGRPSAKLLRSDFVRLSDAAWARGRPTNRLAA